jgi:ABC-type glycerol-3-phosphate transport system substrate-binding protein
MWRRDWKARQAVCGVVLMLVCVVLLGVGGPAYGAAKTTITFWTFLNPEAADPRSKALRATIDGFMADNPDIEVKTESIHWGKIDGLAIQAAAAGGGPDVLNVYSVQLTKHVNAKTVAPLNTYVEKWYGQHKTDYIIAPKETEYDGKVYGLLWETRVWLLYYRQDLLEKAGLKVPHTLDDLAKVAQKIGSDRLQGFVVGLSDTQLAAAFVETFEPLLWGAGGSLLDAKGKAAFNSPAGQQVMQWIADLTRTGGMGKAAASMNADDILSGFKAGTIGMSFQGSMRVSAAREAKDVGPMIRTAPLPGFQAGKPSPGLTAGQSLTIGANSKNKDAAWRFIEYYLSPKAQLLFAKAGVLPIRKSVYADPYFQTPQGQELIQWRDYINNHGRVGRYPEDFAKLSELLARAAQDVVLRNVPVKQALDDAAKKYDAQTGM